MVFFSPSLGVVPETQLSFLKSTASVNEQNRYDDDKEIHSNAPPGNWLGFLTLSSSDTAGSLILSLLTANA